MRRVVAGLLDCVPFDPRSRRALEQTLLDWAHEEAEASRSARRWLVGTRALVAVARAALVCGLSEIGRVPAGWIATRLVLFLGIPVCGVTLWQLTWGPMRPPSPGYPTMLWVTVLPWAMLLSPPAMFLTIAWRPRDRTVPPIGAAVLAFASVLALTGFLLPAVFQHWREEVFRFLTAARAGAGPAPGFAEMSLIGLLRALPGGWSHQVLDMLLRVTGYPALSGAAVLLAGAVVGRRPVRAEAAWWWLPAAAMTYVASITLLLLGFSFLKMRLGDGLVPWAMAVFVLALSIAFTLTHGRDAGQRDVDLPQASA